MFVGAADSALEVVIVQRILCRIGTKDGRTASPSKLWHSNV